MEQKILKADRAYAALDGWLKSHSIRKPMLVCGNSLRRLPISEYFDHLPETAGIELIYFQDFQPNPKYESVVKGVEIYRRQGCDCIIAVGGGSAMDVAKCIKLYANMESSECWLSQAIVPNHIPLLAIPTTAGTGSEATRFAVVYYNGEKQSVAHESCIPEAVLLDPSMLLTLPLYQKKATMLDALCHALESAWSVNSTEESIDIALKAIEMVLANLDGYLANDPVANEGMLTAANLAGKAINITQTTAGHAMCYKITTLFGAAHGHACGLVVRRLWPWMIENVQMCSDRRGESHLRHVFDRIAGAMGCRNAIQASEKFSKIFDSLALDVPAATEAQYALLKKSVNPVRMKNNPVALDEETIDLLYHRILR